jgi:hypothetical protein
MLEAIPSHERSFSVCPMLVAILALIPNIVQTNNHCGGEVELLYGADLSLKDTEVRIPAAQKHFGKPGCNTVLRQAEKRELGLLRK